MSPFLFDLTDRRQPNPEARRLDMHNRAHSEEVYGMWLDASPRVSMPNRRSIGTAATESGIARFVSGLRDGIGHVLISAGNRIQTTA